MADLLAMLEHWMTYPEPRGRIINIQRFDAPPVVHDSVVIDDQEDDEDETVEAFGDRHYEGPTWNCAVSCTTCSNPAWVLTPHPVSQKTVCLECARLAPEGWVACPATHTPGAACPLCRSTPGFVEAL